MLTSRPHVTSWAIADTFIQISWWYFVDAPEFDKHARQRYRIPRSPRGVLASTLGETDSWAAADSEANART